ncbi:MAG TPA: bifunctional phosphoribosyl-AMP cyclohydrolase/phosphoribosyl-ATP diphosphatase HisIE, partial [Thermoleophilia bacterium]|nr:bifunctional phosphoribosyl-AMP cyclohydrolase/phosphoribosyl-ATP diphosphatase HisIE [Thermoleophilia bacterium]
MGGLLPAVVQDADTLQVLMLGYMSREALAKTRELGKVTFFSRSKNRLWTKGETSNNFLELVQVLPDCDHDALLVLARPHGPTCHRETTSCFGDQTAPGVGFLQKLARTIAQRAKDRPAKSYTVELLAAGVPRVAQKVGEEAVETVIAAVAGDKKGLASMPDAFSARFRSGMAISAR